MGSILKQAAGDGATLKLTQRKLDAVGTVNSHCSRADAPERIGKLREAAQLAKSLADRVFVGFKRDRARFATFAPAAPQAASSAAATAASCAAAASDAGRVA